MAPRAGKLPEPLSREKKTPKILEASWSFDGAARSHSLALQNCRGRFDPCRVLRRKEEVAMKNLPAAGALAFLWRSSPVTRREKKLAQSKPMYTRHPYALHQLRANILTLVS